MCGIVGILSRETAAPQLVEALARLEYRGYDSAGVATLEEGVITRRRASGKLRNLAARLATDPLAGRTGIGHTRWATHGAPTEANAHPHATDRVAVVHNGIIENFLELRRECEAAGQTFSSETDTEVIAHLLTLALDRGLTPAEAMAATLTRLEGAFALAVLFAGEDDLLMAARRGSPLAIGHGDGEMFLGSDAIALAPFTRTITYLDEGDWAVVTRESATIFNAAGTPAARPITRTDTDRLIVDKDGYRHFMLKEIHEQPEAITRTLAHYVDFTSGLTRIADGAGPDFRRIDRLLISACGTASYAGHVGKYWFEQIARLPGEIDIASEFRYRDVVFSPNSMALFISQSGETADTLAALRDAKQAGQTVSAVVNVPTSSIARDAEYVFPTLAGPEIGVASTKAFTCQLVVLFVLAVHAARQRGVISVDEEKRLVSAAIQAPRHVATVLKDESAYESVAADLAKARTVLYLGRGTSYPIALEGALKLKEISYVHAEGYAAGELKHGPIALIDETVPVVVLAPSDRWFGKTVSNMQEVAARGGKVILLTDAAGARQVSLKTHATLLLPEVAQEVSPLVYAVAVQLLAYHAAVARGTDVDQPRNLAKSVTVE